MRKISKGKRYRNFFLCFQNSFLISLRRKELFAYSLKLREKQENPYRIEIGVRWDNRTTPRLSNRFYHKPMALGRRLKQSSPLSILRIQK